MYTFKNKVFFKSMAIQRFNLILLIFQGFAIFALCNDFQTVDLNGGAFGIVTIGGNNPVLTLDDVVFIVRSQHDSYHKSKANIFKKKLKEQVNARSIKGQLSIKMLHEDWAPYGSWTIFPIISILDKEHSSSKSWFFFCEDDTNLDLDGILTILKMYDHTKDFFLGHALQDPQPAIIHHFAFHEDTSKFSFPDFSAGWAISSALLKRLAKRLNDSPVKTDFSIDVQHELAMFIHDGGRGAQLTNVRELCTLPPGDDDDCVTSFLDSSASCGEVDMNDLFFAVKTTLKYHKDRVPVIKNTIGQHTSRVVYYSETVDPSIPTEDTGVPNTESGHCAKLWAIMKNSKVNKKASGKKWLIVVDDDTILRLASLFAVIGLLAVAQ